MKKTVSQLIAAMIIVFVTILVGKAERGKDVEITPDSTVCGNNG